MYQHSKPTAVALHTGCNTSQTTASRLALALASLSACQCLEDENAPGAGKTEFAEDHVEPDRDTFEVPTTARPKITVTADGGVGAQAIGCGASRRRIDSYPATTADRAIIATMTISAAVQHMYRQASILAATSARR